MPKSCLIYVYFAIDLSLSHKIDSKTPILLVVAGGTLLPRVLSYIMALLRQPRASKFFSCKQHKSKLNWLKQKPKHQKTTSKFNLNVHGWGYFGSLLCKGLMVLIRIVSCFIQT